MNEIPANRLADFPPDQFGIRVFCTRCDHQAWLDRAALPETLLVRRVTERLRCTVCGSKGAEIRIVYRGAGDFHWGYPAASHRSRGDGEEGERV